MKGVQRVLSEPCDSLQLSSRGVSLVLARRLGRAVPWGPALPSHLGSWLSPCSCQLLLMPELAAVQLLSVLG